MFSISDLEFRTLSSWDCHAGAYPERDSSVALLPQNDKGKLGVRMTVSEGARNDRGELLNNLSNDQNPKIWLTAKFFNNSPGQIWREGVRGRGRTHPHPSTSSGQALTSPFKGEEFYR